MISEEYRAQVDLLLTVLPHIEREEIFALHGGTAINLFVLDMPRLSVDIDLTYLPIEDNRDAALRNISSALNRIEERLRKSIRGISVTRVPDGQDVKLNCQTARATVKVEVNTVIRGTLFPVQEMTVSEVVQNEFGKFAAMRMVAQPQLYGGKICAALDRQHPRDLFDVHLLMDRKAITEEIKQGFMISLLSHARPMHELLRPNFLDNRKSFDAQFAGMSEVEFAYEQYEATREGLVKAIHDGFADADKKFLLSFMQGEPEWDLFPLKDLKLLPAVRWKMQNIQELKGKNLKKHGEMVRALEGVLG